MLNLRGIRKIGNTKMNEQHVFVTITGDLCMMCGNPEQDHQYKEPELIEPVPDGYVVIRFVSGIRKEIYFKDIHHWTRKDWGIIIRWKNNAQEWMPWATIHNVKIQGNSDDYKNLRLEYDKIMDEGSCRSNNCLNYGSLRELDGESN